MIISVDHSDDLDALSPVPLLITASSSVSFLAGAAVENSAHVHRGRPGSRHNRGTGASGGVQQDQQHTAGRPRRQPRRLRETTPGHCGQRQRQQRPAEGLWKEPLRQRDPLRGSHPWVVSVGYKNGDKDTIGCVAVVISRHHVITHAICAATTKYDHVLLKNTAYKVSNRWFHPSLKSDDDVTNGHNIGIVMTEKLVFNDEVQPACLPGINDVVSAVGDGTTTLVGFEASPRGGVTKYLLGPTPRPSIPCSASKPSEPSELEAARVGIRSTRSSTDTHVCVLRPFQRG
nr:uncharacterized protein LOC113815459 [Penaeus vannamei]